jgi:hypothetical protein
MSFYVWVVKIVNIEISGFRGLVFELEKTLNQFYISS